MSATSMSTSNALTVKLWAKDDWANPGMKVAFGHLFKRGSVYYNDKFEKADVRGDQITYSYVNQLTGVPVGEGGTMDGNEEAVDLGSFTMAMNITRIGVLNPNDDTIEQQRTLVDFPEVTRKQLPRRFFRLLDTAVFQQLAGAYPNSWTRDGTTWSGNNRLFVTGHNIPPAPSTDRILRAGGAANDESLTSSNTMTLDLIDYAIEANSNSDQPIEELSDNTFDLYLAPSQVTDLKHDTTGKIQWFNIALAMATSGKYDQLQGAMLDTMPTLGQYGRVNIYEAPRVAYGVNSSTSAVITTARRAVLVGRDALSYASPWGRPDKESGFKYFNQLKDYDYWKGLELRALFGLKKTRPSNGSDIGVFVISTYAAPHS